MKIPSKFSIVNKEMDSFINNEYYNVVDVYNKKKYHIKDYKKFLLEKKENCHLAEIPLFPCPLIVDVDIKKFQDKISNLYDDNFLHEIIKDYIRILKQKLKNPLKYYYVITLTKPPRKTSTGYIKHGFHLHFLSVSLSKEDQKQLHNDVILNSKHGEFIDDPTSKPWLIYNCSKSPDDLPYVYNNCYCIDDNLNISEEDIEELLLDQTFDGELIGENSEKYLTAILSVRASRHFSMQNYLEFSEQNQTEEEVGYEEEVLSENNEERIMEHDKISDLVINGLKTERSANYEDWVKVGMILKSISQENPDYFRNIFHLFSKKSDKYNEVICDQKWNGFSTNSKLTVGTLIYMAKEDGYDMKSFYKKEIPTFDYDIALEVKKFIKEKYITHKDYGCFQATDTIWKEIFGWEGIFKEKIINWFEYFQKNLSFEEKKTVMFKILKRKIKNYSPLNNIVKSLFDLYFDRCVIDLFEQKENYIALNNCIFDINNWKIISLEDIEEKIYFSTKIHHDYIDWKDVQEPEKNIVYDFFEKIFPNPELRKYCVKNLAMIITGRNYFKQFQFWTGTGNNGKSVCINLLEYIFGRMVMKIPKSMITGILMKQGGANPELYRLKDARIAIIDEVTNNDYLDPGQIKGLSGNDKLLGRDLYQKSKEMKEMIPMFFPILITNETPIIKRPDDATWERIRLINFESKFKSEIKETDDKNLTFLKNPGITKILQKNSKYFLSYFFSILFSYENLDMFSEQENVPQKVIEGLENFKAGQNILKQFLDENYIVDEHSKEIISVQKLMKDYNNTKPKITLKFEEVESAINSYKLLHPKINIFDGKIKGLSKLEY